MIFYFINKLHVWLCTFNSQAVICSKPPWKISATYFIRQLLCTNTSLLLTTSITIKYGTFDRWEISFIKEQSQSGMVQGLESVSPLFWVLTCTIKNMYLDFLFHFVYQGFRRKPWSTVLIIVRSSACIYDFLIALYLSFLFCFWIALKSLQVCWVIPKEREKRKGSEGKKRRGKEERKGNRVYMKILF